MATQSVFQLWLIGSIAFACETSRSLNQAGPPAAAECAQVNRKNQLDGRASEAVMRAAEEVLDLPMGSGRVKVVNGKPYLFCVEPHNNRPSKAGPDGFHKGVTVFSR